MTANDTAAKERIVSHLDFTPRTSKRVTWEQFEFTIEGPHLVRVTNASYGFLKDEHSYTVGVAERDGQLLPAECDCPADLHHDTDCKHKVALGLCGGSVVMQAAADYNPASGAEPRHDASTAAEKLRTDGGELETGQARSPLLDEPNHAECDCTELPGDFPCWPCVRYGRKELPE